MFWETIREIPDVSVERSQFLVFGAGLFFLEVGRSGCLHKLVIPAKNLIAGFPARKNLIG